MSSVSAYAVDDLYDAKDLKLIIEILSLCGISQQST